MDHDKYLELHDLNLTDINKRRELYEQFDDIEESFTVSREFWREMGTETAGNEKNTSDYACVLDDLNAVHNDDLRQVKVPFSSSGVVKKRTNVSSASEYCKLMRSTNFDQRALIKHCIAKISDASLPPIQIFFTGCAGTGKSHTLRPLMGSVNLSVWSDSLF